MILYISTIYLNYSEPAQERYFADIPNDSTRGSDSESVQWL